MTQLFTGSSAKGIFLAIGLFMLSRVYCLSKVSVDAPFEFSYLIRIVIFGYLIWSETPGPTTLLGVLTLVCWCLYIRYRECQTVKLEENTRSGQPSPIVNTKGLIAIIDPNHGYVAT